MKTFEKPLYIISVWLWLLLAIGCADKYPSGDFRAVVISDTHISSDELKVQRLNGLIQKINDRQLPGVEMLIVTGDVVSAVYGSYVSDNPDTSDNRLARAVDIFNHLNVPFYLVMGNHDYKIGRDRDSDTYFPESEILQMEEIWKRYTGLNPYYVFTHRCWKFVILNSMRGRYLNSYFDDMQLDWLKAQLSGVQPVVLFVHHPLETDHFRIWCKPKDLINTDKEPRFFEIVRGYKQNIKGIFVGHGHRWISDTLFETIPVFETGSFGDANEPVYYIVGFQTGIKNIQVARNSKILIPGQNGL